MVGPPWRSGRASGPPPTTGEEESPVRGRRAGPGPKGQRELGSRQSLLREEREGDKVLGNKNADGSGRENKRRRPREWERKGSNKNDDKEWEVLFMYGLSQSQGRFTKETKSK